MATGEGVRSVERARRWTFASGMTMILLAVLAGLLPLVHWAPKGGVVGWLLFLTGLAELALGTRRAQGRVRTAAIGSALLTTGAGLIFIANPLARYFSVANVVTIWLILRGVWVLAMALLLRAPPASRWLGLSGVTDLLLALALAAGIPVAVLVVTLFGPTPYIVAKFSIILATSFLVTGISYLAISRIAARPAAVPSD